MSGPIDLLDGDNDGTPGGDYVTPTTDTPGRIHRLNGDFDGTARVDAIDFGAFRLLFGSGGGGSVDAVDFGAFLTNFGKSL